MRCSSEELLGSNLLTTLFRSTQGSNGIELCRARRRIETEYNAHGGGDAEGEKNGDGAKHIGQAQAGSESDATAQAENNANDAACYAQHQRFSQELAADIATARPDGHADADLACALGHRDKHDVHDADAADGKRDRSDTDE